MKINRILQAKTLLYVYPVTKIKKISGNLHIDAKFTNSSRSIKKENIYKLIYKITEKEELKYAAYITNHFWGHSKANNAELFTRIQFSELYIIKYNKFISIFINKDTIKEFFEIII